MRETWYVLEDGTVADPSECAPDEYGVLRHKGGVAVALRENVPRSRSVDPDDEHGKPKHKSRELKAEAPKKPYRTRESKAE